MMMRLILQGIILLLPLAVASQEHWCGFDHPENKLINSPSYLEFLARIRGNEATGTIKFRSEQFVQVVVHAVIPDGFQPLSRAQVLHQLDVLNADFAGRGENIPGLPEEFRALVADVNIRFCLADRDPQGQPTDGITTTYTSVRDIALQTGPGGRMAIHYDVLEGKTGWDPTRYINIWVGEYGSFLGSSSFPGMSAYEEEIGLVMNIRHFGSIGDAGLSGWYGRGHTLTHEMGHFFGLLHIWGEGLQSVCDDSDSIDDTPNAAGPYYNCPSGEHVSCGSPDMYQNFMDLTDDRCLAAFTPGQAQRMQLVLDQFYPGLVGEGPCGEMAGSFSEWYVDLQWSYDQPSGRYIIYHDDRLGGSKVVLVYASDGRIVQEDRWRDSFAYLLDLHHVGPGIYFVWISDGSKYHVRRIAVY